MANPDVSTTMDDTNTHWQSIFVGVVIAVVVAFLIIYIVMKSAPRIIVCVIVVLIIALIKRRGIKFRLPRNRKGKYVDVFVGFFLHTLLFSLDLEILISVPIAEAIAIFTC